jgi:uncharacterized repeat protein (TIGR03987 family)
MSLAASFEAHRTPSIGMWAARIQSGGPPDRRQVRYDGCMSVEMVASSTLITLALVFYTTAVWAERVQRYLKRWHLVLFWAGLVFDASGTYAMGLLSEGGLDWTDFHTLTGQAAIWLMFAHTVWASWVVARGSEQGRQGFHRFSLLVWLVWLVPYLGGAFMGMSAAGG